MFDENFEVFLADTSESKEIHYSIRYQVYCEEMGFENKDDFPLEQEFDEYDNHSVHFIARHKKSGKWVGAMRLIVKKNQLLPIEQHCIFDETIEKSGGQKSVELSRLCIVQEIRRTISDTNPPCGITGENEEIKETDKVKSLHKHHRINRSIIWGIINAASEYCYVNNIQNWYFMTNSALAKVLNKSGCNMLRLGGPVDYKGERFPFKKNVFEAYHSEIWRKSFRNGYGYRMFSEFEYAKELGEKAA